MNAIQDVQKKITPPKVYTLEAYLLKEERSASKNEFYDGRIVPMPGSKYAHNKISLNTIIAIDKAISGLATYFEVLHSDQKVYIEAENTALYPDALVISEKPEFWQGRTDLITNPVVIVEVLSRSTRKYDLKDKFSLYKLIPSFKEYIVIEQNKPGVESWFKQDEETWKINRFTELNQALHIRSLSVNIPPAEIYKRIEFVNK